MQAQQLSVKLYARTWDVRQADFIGVFHRWIREHRLGAALLIDVADYSHVPDGPGVMIVGDQAHWAMDEADPGPGVLYSRKRDPIGDVGPKLTDALLQALTAAQALEQEPALAGRLAFDTDRALVQVMSRLVAPNTVATWTAFEPHIRAAAARLFAGEETTLTHLDDPRRPFGVRVDATGTPDLSTLLSRMAG